MRPREQVFVLRLWLEPQDSGLGVWRASVTSPTTQQRQFFSDPAQLSSFLFNNEPEPFKPISDAPEGAQEE